MTQIAHSERAHALLGASKAEQWINCPPSARTQEGIDEKRSEYADEGTLAHELAEVKLTRRLTVCNSAKRRELDKRLKQIQANDFYGVEMENAIQEYVEFVEERFMDAKSRSADAVISLEEQLDFSEWVPEGFGTGDVVLISDGVLEVIDLKYGKGVPVSAIDNPQIRLYALGARASWEMLYDIREVRMTIHQPRLDSITTDTMSVTDLLEWAATVVKPAAKLAFVGEGEFHPGDHCRWCKVKATCRARADANMEALKYEFQDPALMTNDEIGSILFIADQLSKWAGDVTKYAQEQALKGEKIPQWKLVEGRSNRKIADVEAAKKIILDAGYEESKIMKPQELVAMGQLESKIIGKKKFQELLGGLIVKPPGKPVLVPETDPRPEMNSIEKDFENIDMED